MSDFFVNLHQIGDASYGYTLWFLWGTLALLIGAGIGFSLAWAEARKQKRHDSYKKDTEK